MDIPVDLDRTLGALFVGNIVAVLLYGITCTQTFMYSKDPGKDSRGFRLVIFLLWVLDTLQIVFTSHALYYYLISTSGQETAIQNAVWSIITPIYVVCFSNLIIRIIFARRIWILDGRNKIFVGCIPWLQSRHLSSESCVLLAHSSITLSTYSIPHTCPIRFQQKKWANYTEISYLLYIALTGDVVSDILIAGSLCVSLSRTRSGLPRFNSLINVLMKYTINTCALSALSSIACLVAYTSAPQDSIYISIYLSFGKLFLMSLLATLNNRGALSAKYTRVPIGSVPSWIGTLELVENGGPAGTQPAVPLAPTDSIVLRPHRTPADRGTSFPSQ